jgi:hypothetical protein
MRPSDSMCDKAQQAELKPDRKRKPPILMSDCSLPSQPDVNSGDKVKQSVSRSDLARDAAKRA